MSHVVLDSLLGEIKFIKTNFDSFTCHHVYREQNRTVDALSKEGLQMDEGQWLISKHLNEEDF